MNSSSANRFFVETVLSEREVADQDHGLRQPGQDNVSVLPAVMRTSQARTLRESAERAITHYLKTMDGAPVSELYDMVLAEVELPLLQKILEYTRGNQSKAAEYLGINRGTLRKKLKAHNLI